MLTDYELKKWRSNKNLPFLSISTLTDIRSSEPTRRVGVEERMFQVFTPVKRIEKAFNLSLIKSSFPLFMN